MCLNEILKDEQIMLIRYSQSTDPREKTSLKGRLISIKHLLEAHPYPHHPYAQRGLDRERSGPGGADLRNSAHGVRPATHASR
jgi:hypothetical protein